MKLLIFHFLVFLLLPNFAQASEQFYSGTAVNNETRQCKSTMLGDSTRLKSGWEFYTSNSEYKYVFQPFEGNTPYDNCRQKTNSGDCCRDLGYQYVDVDIINPAPYYIAPEENKKTDWSLLAGITIVVSGLIGLVYYFVRKK